MRRPSNGPRAVIASQDPLRLAFRRLCLAGSLAALPFQGCGAEPAAPPTAAATTSSSTATAAAASEPSANGTPASPAAAPQTSGQQLTQAAPAPARPAVAATADQIAGWGITDSPPLQLLACYDGFSDALIQGLALAPDGKQFALGGARLTTWNISEPQPTADLLADLKEEDVERPIRAIGISPDGQWLAAGDMKGRLRIWDRKDPAKPTLVKAHEGRLTQLAFSPDSKTLATTSYSGEVRLWRLPGGEKGKSLKIDKQELQSLAFLTETLLATAGREATVWNIESGEKVATLTTGRLVGAGLGVSNDHRWLAFSDSDSKTKLWEIPRQALSSAVLPVAAHRIVFSPDGRRIATDSGDRAIRIWDAITRQVIQVIDADGGRTTGLAWLPENGTLLIATEEGRLRLWGTSAGAKGLGLEPIASPALRAAGTAAKHADSPARLEQVIDVRSFPRLPDAQPMWSYGGSDTYATAAPQEEVETFYRHVLGKAGWKETPADPLQPGLNFQKADCLFNVSVSPAYPTPGEPVKEGAGGRQVTLRFAGNYDAHWLPKVSPIDSPANLASFSMVHYRTRMPLTDLEVAVLQKLREAGWVPYSRLATSHSEEPHSRSLTLVQGGSLLTVSIGPPADAPGELVVQMGVNLAEKSLPLPADASWIEFDVSTDLRLVASTKLSLAEAAKFFDTEMPLDGWLAREAGRRIDDEKGRGWLPYIRGQRDVLIRLVAMPAGGTRIFVGDAERTSWQVKAETAAKSPEAKGKSDKPGIEAADFELPKGAAAVKFDIDGKQIEYELAGTTPPKLVEQFVKQMEGLGWKRDGAGVLSDEYCFVTYELGKSEIQFRGRADGKKTSVIVSGDGLLWTKPLPAAPVRISYETWLRRSGKPASLEYLDEFAAEMHKIPETAAAK